tara:strand:+ start:303 stop:473 length:171 start_codon:yes stop_codon:yes gene_type:complete
VPTLRLRLFFTSLSNGGKSTVDETIAVWKVARRFIRGLGAGTGTSASDPPPDSVQE